MSALSRNGKVRSEGLPPPKLDDHNDPVWTLPTRVDVHRMDNSLPFLHQEVATLKTKDGRTTGFVSVHMAGLAIFVSLQDKRHGHRLYSVPYKSIVDLVTDHDDEFVKVKRVPLRKADDDARRASRAAAGRKR